LAQSARDGASERHERLRAAIERVLDKKLFPATRGLGHAKKIRLAVREELPSTDTTDTEWPAVKTIKDVVRHVLDERGVPHTRRVSK
jgi:hypothetical protein